MARLQTLDRGLEILELVSNHRHGLSVAEIARHLDVHRAIAYRLIATLEARRFVFRGTDGRIQAGGGMIALVAGTQQQLSARALPHLQALAQATDATAYLAIAQGNECLVILVAEPEHRVLRVGYRIGSRHPLDVGASGIAILSGRAARATDSAAVEKARSDGYAVTSGQIQAGAVGVAAPILAHEPSRLWFEACVGVVAMSDLNIDAAANASMTQARRLAEDMRR